MNPQDGKYCGDCCMRCKWMQDKMIKAEKSLIAAGFTDNGGELWKPPLGPSCKPLLDRIDRLEATLESCNRVRRAAEEERDRLIAELMKALI